MFIQSQKHEIATPEYIRRVETHTLHAFDWDTYGRSSEEGGHLFITQYENDTEILPYLNDHRSRYRKN